MSQSPHIPRRWPRWLVVGVVAGFLLAASPSPVVAAKPSKGPPWLKLDRVEAESSWLAGIVRLRVYVSAIKLSGGTIDVHGKHAWTLQAGSSKKKLPYISGSFGKVDDDIAITIVLCTSMGFSEELPAIKKALAAMLARLPKNTKVAIVSYGEEVDGDRRVGPMKRALSNLDDLETEPVPPSEPQLIRAVRKATTTFRKLKPSAPGRSVRKLMLVISDGQDLDHSAARFRQAARKADRMGIRIHSLAYSRENRRAPMLGLAELSKQTFGTFRLARSKTSFGAQLSSLGDELDNQYVLTYLVPEKAVRGKRLQLLADGLTSNQVKLKSIRCGKRTCESDQYCARGACVSRRSPDGGGILGWILLIGGGALGVLVLLLGVGFLLSRRQKKAEAQAALFASIAGGADASQQAAAAPPVGRVTGQAPPVGRVTGQPAPGHARPQPAATSARAASLFMVKGDRQGQYLPIHHGFRIGKAPDCNLVLSDGFASSHHCHIELDKGGNATLIDDRSTNGTFVNGVRASRNRLTHGMLIKIGQTEIRFMQG